MPIRLATAVLFIVASVLVLAVPIPGDLPAVALGQVAVYRLEVLLALVYGGLLLLTPLFQGVFYGRLPIEISHRGAKWPEPAEEAVARLQARVLQLEEERAMVLQSKHLNRGE